MSLVDDPIIRPRQIRAATGLSKPTIYRMMEKGEFPRPMKLSAGAVGWRQSTIEKWREERGLAGGGELPEDPKQH
jgi:prophage regulatory protein